MMMIHPPMLGWEGYKLFNNSPCFKVSCAFSNCLITKAREERWFRLTARSNTLSVLQIGLYRRKPGKKNTWQNAEHAQK